jgi:hypothetical protein
MDWILILAVLVVLAVVVVLASGPLRSSALKRRFGDEYDRVLEAEGDRRRAEAALRERARRRAAFETTDLDPAARDRYLEQLRDVQWGFVDDPVRAVAEVGALVQEVMRERGYPVDGFEARAEMLSVDYPTLAEKYRWAYAVQYQGEQELTTNLDELRRAFQYHRSLVQELVGETVKEATA